MKDFQFCLLEYHTDTKFCRNTNFCRGLPELKIVKFVSTFEYFYILRPVAASEELQLAVQ